MRKRKFQPPCLGSPSISLDVPDNAKNQKTPAIVVPISTSANHGTSTNPGASPVTSPVTPLQLCAPDKHDNKQARFVTPRKHRPTSDTKQDNTTITVPQLDLSASTTLPTVSTLVGVLPPVGHIFGTLCLVCCVLLLLHFVHFLHRQAVYQSVPFPALPYRHPSLSCPQI